MLDEFRKQASESMSEEPPPETFDEAPQDVRSRGKLFGMTPVQRFVIALILLILALLLGTFCLLITEKVFPPFL